MNVVPQRYLGQRDRNDKQDNEYWKEPEKPAYEKLQVCLMLFIQCEYDDEAANDHKQINRIPPYGHEPWYAGEHLRFIARVVHNMADQHPQCEVSSQSLDRWQPGCHIRCVTGTGLHAVSRVGPLVQTEISRMLFVLRQVG